MQMQTQRLWAILAYLAPLPVLLLTTFLDQRGMVRGPVALAAAVILAFAGIAVVTRMASMPPELLGRAGPGQENPWVVDPVPFAHTLMQLALIALPVQVCRQNLQTFTGERIADGKYVAAIWLAATVLMCLPRSFYRGIPVTVLLTAGLAWTAVRLFLAPFQPVIHIAGVDVDEKALALAAGLIALAAMGFCLQPARSRHRTAGMIALAVTATVLFGTTISVTAVHGPSDPLAAYLGNTGPVVLPISEILTGTIIPAYGPWLVDDVATTLTWLALASAIAAAALFGRLAASRTPADDTRSTRWWNREVVRRALTSTLTGAGLLAGLNFQVPWPHLYLLAAGTALAIYAATAAISLWTTVTTTLGRAAVVTGQGALLGLVSYLPRSLRPSSILWVGPLLALAVAGIAAAWKRLRTSGSQTSQPAPHPEHDVEPQTTGPQKPATDAGATSGSWVIVSEEKVRVGSTVIVDDHGTPRRATITAAADNGRPIVVLADGPRAGQPHAVTPGQIMRTAGAAS